MHTFKNCKKTSFLTDQMSSSFQQFTSLPHTNSNYLFLTVERDIKRFYLLCNCTRKMTLNTYGEPLPALQPRSFTPAGHDPRNITDTPWSYLRVTMKQLLGCLTRPVPLL